MIRVSNPSLTFTFPISLFIFSFLLIIFFPIIKRWPMSTFYITIVIIILDDTFTNLSWFFNISEKVIQKIFSLISLAYILWNFRNFFVQTFINAICFIDFGFPLINPHKRGSWIESYIIDNVTKWFLEWLELRFHMLFKEICIFLRVLLEIFEIVLFILGLFLEVLES